MQTVTPDPAPVPPRAWQRWLPFAITALYLAIMIPLLLRHGIWRDEAQAFLIARDSTSIPQMFHNLNLEGHPPLWYLLLHALTRLWPAPESMQFLHLALAAASVFLVARFAPFPLPAKLLFPFGYYTLFEYGLISRNYQLQLLLGLLFCIAWCKNRNAHLTFGILLALLSWTHAFGIIIAGALALMILLDAATRSVNRNATLLSPRFLAGAAIALAGLLSGAILTKPGAGAAVTPPWLFDLQPAHITQTVRALANAFLPWPPWTLHFRDVSIFTDAHAALLGLLAEALALLCLLNSWRATAFLLTAHAGLLAFFHVKFPGEWHHHGMLFIAWILALWIAWNDTPSFRWTRTPAFQKMRATLTTLLLLSQTAGAAAPVYFSANFPFSRSRDTADFLRAHLHPGDIVAADLPLIAASVAAYLPQPIDYPSEHRQGSYALWTTRWWTGATAADIQTFATAHPHRILFIHCSTRGELPGAQKLAIFPAGIVPDEEFSIFELNAPPPTHPSAPAP